jgi:hypothetical protein
MYYNNRMNKKKPGRNRMIQVVLRFPPELYAEVQAVADEECRFASSVIRQAVVAWLGRRKELKEKAVQDFEASLKAAMADMGEYQRLLLLRELNASIDGFLSKQAKKRRGGRT